MGPFCDSGRLTNAEYIGCRRSNNDLATWAYHHIAKRNNKQKKKKKKKKKKKQRIPSSRRQANKYDIWDLKKSLQALFTQHILMLVYWQYM